MVCLTLTQPKRNSTEQTVLKYVKLKYLILLMPYLLSNMKATSSATEPANFIPVVDMVHWLADETKQASPETVQ
jgi:hypothetical protein